MPSYSVSTWKADNASVDDQGNYILIEGREEGLVGWLLTRVGIAQRMCLAISGERIEFRAMSLANSLTRSIPLENVCSVEHGFRRPIWSVLLLTVLLVGIGGMIGMQLGADVGRGVGATVGLLVGVILFLLNRRLYLAFMEMSGRESRVQFKGSLVEGIVVDQQAAHYVAVLAQALVDARVTARAVVNPPNN